MRRTAAVLSALVLAGATGWLAVAMVRGEQAETPMTPARPVRQGDAEARPAEGPTVTPPPPLPDVEIPPIPEVDQDPFKPGLPPIRLQPPDVLEEGKRLFNREGRLEVDPIGRAVFVFDSGDKPMHLLENTWREFLEQSTDFGKKKARWRVSGIVTVYGKRNYLLLTKCVQIMPEEEKL